MALSTPIVYPISAFDAEMENRFYFTSSGGDQVVSNRLVIKDNVTNEIVYNTKIENYGYYHDLPANTLVNGRYYYYYFYTYNYADQESASSNSVSFYCYTTPVVSITNIPEDDIIRNANYDFEISYYQAEDEMLNTLIATIYDANNNILDSRDVSKILLYSFSGLENNQNYKIVIEGTTVNNTIFSYTKNFGVVYSGLILHSDLEVVTNSNLGYNQVTSNFIAIDGESFGDVVYTNQPDDFNQEMILLPKYNFEVTPNTITTKIEWNKGFFVSNDFALGLWLYVRDLGKIATITKDNDTNNGFSFYLRRGDYEGQSTICDYIEILGYKNGELISKTYSNPLTNAEDQSVLSNEGSFVWIWFKRTNGETECQFEVLQQIGLEDRILQWNNSAETLSIGCISNMYIDNSTDLPSPMVIAENNRLNSIFPLTSVMITNGKYDGIYITADSEMTPYKGYVEGQYVMPEWDVNTILNCDFDHNINGGKIEITLSEISGIVIKRREKNKKWITIYKQDVYTRADLNVSIKDSMIPSGITQEYAVVPIKQGGVEGEYIIVESTPCWNGVFISTKDKIYKLYNGVTYGSLKRNKQIGEFIPIGSIYPTDVQNGISKYDTLSISGGLYGYNYENTRIINRADVIKQSNDLLDTLHSDESLVITDWNGNIWLGRCSTSPTISFVQSYGNGLCNISFDFTEQGKYDNAKDLYENGIIDMPY